MAEQVVETGDKVSWQWGSGAPSGTVAEVAKEAQVSVESDKGNTITKNAEPENPAVHVERPGNDVVKKASELEVEQKADGNKDEEPAKGETGDKDEELKGKEEDATAGAEKDKEEKKEEEKADKDEKPEEAANGEAKVGEAKVGEKRDKEEQENGEKAEANGEAEKKDDAEEPAAKKQKTDETEEKEEANDAGKKKGGRAKAASRPKKEPKKAATATGEPRRSSRIKSS